MDRTGVTPWLHAGIKLDDRVIIPDGSEVEVRKVRSEYEHLVTDWRKHRTTSVARALLCESDPYHDVPTGLHLNIAGHSHNAMVKDNLGYINLGSWCGKDAYFAKTWLEYGATNDELLCGALFKLQDGVSTQQGKTVTVRTRLAQPKAA